MTATVAPADSRPRAVHPSWVPLAAAAGALGLLMPACLWTAARTHPAPAVHDLALFVHLASLVVGFGAVLSVDWVGLLWVLRRRTLADVLATAANVHVPIWCGYAGLVLSGLLLEPDLSSPLTRVKLGVVLLIGWNGLVALRLHRLLESGPRARTLLVGAVCAGTSQLGWWGAVVIGHLNAH